MTKVLIFAGGLGTRLTEETILKPKPMVDIGGKPMLWHIMKSYAKHGFNDFIVLLGYKGEAIKEYFLNFCYFNNSFEINLRGNEAKILDPNHSHEDNCAEDWKVTLLDTGLHTQTGGRLKRAKQLIGNETFMATYGDGVTDMNIKELFDFHKQHGKLATLTAVLPPARFGALDIQGEDVKQFVEKPIGSETLVNGGFYVFEPGIFDYIEGDHMPLEKAPMAKLAESGQLKAFKHFGFWQCMDTRRDVDMLNELWASGKAGWKTW